jgi:hypothetical protein
MTRKFILVILAGLQIFASCDNDNTFVQSGGEFSNCQNGALDSGFIEVTDDRGVPYYSKVIYRVCNGNCIYEGDMVIQPIKDTSGQKLVRPNRIKKWDLQTVYYVYDSTFTRQSAKDIVRKAMLKIWLLTDIEFKPASEGGAGVKPLVISDAGKWLSNVGYTEHDTCRINLSSSKPEIIQGKIMHELLHILGFLHEQSRPDRDKYIQVDFTNIAKGMEGNYKKLDAANATDYGEYDFNSIMHYDSGINTDMAADRTKPIIKPLPAYKAKAKAMGQRDSLSTQDIYGIKKFYNLTPNSLPYERSSLE